MKATTSPLRRRDAGVARGAEALVDLHDIPHGGEILHDFLRVVLRAVVDEDDFVVGVVEMLERIEAIAQRARAVVGADHDGDHRERHGRDEALVERTLRIFEERLESAVARLGFALRRDDAEGPVGDVDAVGEPLVGPREDEGAGEPAFEDGGDVLGQQRGLLLLRMADGVHAKFAEDERLVAREILQAAEVADEVLLAMEIDVVAVEIDLARQEIFGRRKIRVGGEGEGIVLLDDAHEGIEEFLHAPRAVPADEVGRDFVVDEEAEHGGMAGVGQRRPWRRCCGWSRRPRGRRGRGRACATGMVTMTRRRYFLREVEEPARRRVVDAQDVDAEIAHEAEIDRDLFRRGEIQAAFGRGAERAVGHALEIELVFALKEKLRPHLEAGKIGRGNRRRGNYIMHGAEFPRGGHLRQVRNIAG